MSQEQISRRKFVRDSATVTAGAAVGASLAGSAAAADKPDPKKTRSYNEKMEYRRLGRTNLMISAICIGGHWKKIGLKHNSPEFDKNRRETLSACIDHGINYVDACVGQECMAYSKALEGRRDKMYMGFSWYQRESRFGGWQNSLDKMKEGFETSLKDCKLDHADLWRITMHEQTSKRNTPKQIEIAMEALDWAKKSGKARFTGVSTHDRPWIAEAVGKYPQLEVICTPYTAKTAKAPEGSMFDALEKHDVGMFGIKPFASGSVFKSRGQPKSATKEEDDKIARMVLRHILCCKEITAPIPGLVTVEQVANAAKAVTEPREFSQAEAQQYEQITKNLWDRLPPDYKWLRDWEWV